MRQRYLNDGIAAVKVAELSVGSNSYTLPAGDPVQSPTSGHSVGANDSIQRV